MYQLRYHQVVTIQNLLDEEEVKAEGYNITVHCELQTVDTLQLHAVSF